MNRLWFKSEAKIWEKALPAGNSRIGEVVFSDPPLDRIQINKDTLWPSFPT